ncbi:hypothetical protein HDV64DRAFT_170837 [Trichoderma sp. TUCIM 5745]
MLERGGGDGKEEAKVACGPSKGPALPFLYEFIFSSSLLLFNKAVELFHLGQEGGKEIYPTIKKGKEEKKGLRWIGKPALVIFFFFLACINSRSFLYGVPLFSNRIFSPVHIFFLFFFQPFQLVLPIPIIWISFPFSGCRRWMGSHSAVAYGDLRNIFTYYSPFESRAEVASWEIVVVYNVACYMSARR